MAKTPLSPVNEFVRSFLGCFHDAERVDAHFTAEVAAQDAKARAEEALWLARYRAAIAADPALFYSYGL